ncbi:RagB/SusD family nutrient uptake outer membrane protein [Pedobacter sp. MC2016-14]|uniref:RagB/SusD family nutrient uptake outer membrane protein n=1 Tax=Pedobacter sp. MC2016-14 TaxID=2897327 RepID=UPI001E2ECAB4|nr:RagB/SusD family nutrient uptake outer membrane protein [Pedobacter sp. MC2016-14]MCD0490542.1 RagB/SusD family nutrient uptake outer membrane protein [Pedobacter sp. MC2016-14]
MKNIYKSVIIGSLLAGLVFQSCEKGLKDETFSSYDENVLTKPVHAEQAVRGAYAALNNGGHGYYAGRLYQLYEYPTDIVTSRATSAQQVNLDQLIYDANNATINSVWTDIYRLVSRTNEAEALINRIDYVGNHDTDQHKRENLGEVKFLRALAYYDLTAIWGGVPLIIKASAEYTDADENPPIAPLADVENAIIADLTYAEVNLPSGARTTEVARATQAAAKSLLARLYMRRREWQKAADKCAEVITAGGYDLRTIAEGGITSLYSTGSRSDNEFIFVLKSSSESGSYGITSNSFGINSVPWDYNKGWGNWPIRLQFYATFAQNDQRRNLLTGFYKVETANRWISVPVAFGGRGGTPPDTVAATVVHNLKYPHVNNYNYAGYNNVPIIRYADVLMMRAEALNELNGPGQNVLSLLDEVRNRSGLPNLLLSNFTTKEALRDFIFDERAKEFFMEGRRRDDLFRWGRSASNGTNHLLKFREKVRPTLTDQATYSDNVNYELYPYPLSEIQSNTSFGPQLNAGRVK